MGLGQLGTIHQAAEGLFNLFLFNSIQFSNLFHPGKQWGGEGQGRGECVHSHHNETAATRQSFAGWLARISANFHSNDLAAAA